MNTPVVIFAYNRAKKLKACIDSLSSCDGHKNTEVYIFANGTLDVRGKWVEDTDKDTYFTVNPLLSKYLEIKNGDETIPLENLSIHPLLDPNRIIPTFVQFESYLDLMKMVQDALDAKRWNAKAKGETREEYTARIMDMA